MWRVVFFAGIAVAALQYIRWSNQRRVPDDKPRLSTPPTKEEPSGK
jgi:hypothetical protein